jgi:hypothetical protein
VEGATSYTLQEDDDPNFGSPNTVYSGPNSYFAVSGHATGVWYYQVMASDGSRNSPWSNVQSVTVGALDAPLLYDITNPDGGPDYLVNWSDVTGADWYTLQVDDDPGFGSPDTPYAGSDSSFAVYGQPSGTWYYRVRASNAGTDSDWSNVQSVTVN